MRELKWKHQKTGVGLNKAERDHYTQDVHALEDFRREFIFLF